MEPASPTRIVRPASTRGRSRPRTSAGKSDSIPQFTSHPGLSPMRRREFITLLGGAAASSAFCPRSAPAQQAARPVIGYIGFGSLDNSVVYLAAFRKGLGETGFVEGQNVAIEYRWLEGQYDRMPDLAADLVRHGVAVIATPGTPPASVRAAMATTATI